MTRPRKKSRRKRDSKPGSSALEADALPLGQRGGPPAAETHTTCTIPEVGMWLPIRWLTGHMRKSLTTTVNLTVLVGRKKRRGKEEATAAAAAAAVAEKFAL